MIDDRSYTHNLSSCEIKAWKKKNSGLDGIWTHDLCDTGASTNRAIKPTESWSHCEIICIIIFVSNKDRRLNWDVAKQHDNSWRNNIFEEPGLMIGQ